MDRVTTVLQFQWRAYWRRFRRGSNVTTNNAGVLILLLGLGAIRYFQQLPPATQQLASGETTRYEALLFVVFLVWLLPVMGESKRSIATNRLVHLPLTNNDLFLIRLSSVFCSPVAWIVVAGTLTLCYPLALARNPLTGVVALIVFLVLGFFVSLTITDLLQSRLARRLLLIVAFAASVCGGLLWTNTRAALFASLPSFLPHRLAGAAAVSTTPLRSLAGLFVTTSAFALLSRWAFSFTLQPRADRRSQAFTFFGALQLPGKLGGLIKKDVRYASRLLDLYLALPIVVLFNIYLLANPAPSSVALFIVVGCLFLPCLGIAFNVFGLDTTLGLDRYTLLPLSNKEKLLSKNLAFALLMFCLFITLVPLAFWKLGTRAIVLGFVELVIVTLAYVSFGNWLSVRQPFKMQFYRFSSGGSPVDALVGTIFGSIPALVIIILLMRGGSGVVWPIALLLIVCASLFFFSLSRTARLLEKNWEQLRRSLQ